MKYKLNGQWYDISIPSYDATPVGTIIPYAGENIPTGYILCNGQQVFKANYPELYIAIQDAYNLPSDTDTLKFRVPNIKGRVLVGLDTSQTEFDTLGEKGGSKTNKLTPENYFYNNWISMGITGQNLQKNFSNGADFGINTATNSNTNTPVNNLQPYIVVNYIIKAHPSAVNTSEVVNEYSTSETDVYSANYVNTQFAGIVESGSNNNGSWIKYSDGTMICHKIVNTTITNWETWGTSVEGSINGGDFPQTFYSVPSISVCNTGQGGAAYESCSGVTTTGYGRLYFMRPQSQTSTSVKINIIAIGRWKA